MPPTAAAIRKASLLSSAAGDPSSSNNVRRTNSGRAVRTNTTRPANYYARPYARQGPEDLTDDTTATGFFPALTFFTDAVTALPKEVMRHLTLMKEVEAKVHGPNERLGEAVDALLEQPVPRRSDNASGPHGGMLSFTAANSAIGSANVSLVNGVAPYGATAGQDSTAASVAGEDTAQDGEGDMERRKQYHELRMITHNLLANLDEKNVVLTEANRVLSLQMSRLDSVMPHVEEEIPEEARLGSMTHWAYSDNRLKVKPLPPAASERNRRDVALTNSLAAAASAIHETDILAARRDATKDTGKEKTGRGRQREQFDSEFEDRPKKTTAKVARGKAAAAAAAAAASSATGLGISTNGEPVKRRKVDKVAGAPAMERQASTKSKVGKETPRSTPAAEPTKKVAKSKAAPPAPPKRKNVSSAQATPVAAASPLQATFSAAQTDANAGRPQSARLTKTSTTNLRHEKVMDQEESRPTTASSKSNGEKEKTAGKKRARDEEEPAEAAEPAPDENVQETTMKHEDMESSVQRPIPSRSNSSKKTSSRQSNTGTPRAEDPGSDTAMARTRSTRSMRGNGETPGSETPNYPRANHKRAGHGGSMSGLMRQIAPFNRSPDHGRDEDDPDEDLDSNSEGEGRFRARSSMRRSNTGSRNVSRRTTSRKRSGNSSRDRERRRGGEKRLDDRDTEMANATDDKNVVSSREPPGSPPPAPALTHSPSPSLSSQAPSPSQLTPAPQTQRSPPPPAATRSPEREAEAEAEPEVENDPASSLPPSSAASPLASPIPDSPPRAHQTRGEARTEQVPSRAESEAPATDDEDPDPDDPSEPKYCYCLRGSYGDMVGCDNPKCEREWFHLGCTDLEIMPGEEESWFCTLCRPRGRLHGVGSRGGARGGGGGRGKRGRGRGRGG